MTEPTLVERLRDHAERGDSPIAREAAAEIKRLTAENEKLREIIRINRIAP